MLDDDRDLYECFAAVRREEEERLPASTGLSLTSRQHRRRRLSGRLAAATVCLAALIVAVVWLRPGHRVPHERSNRAPEQAVASITSWKPATDFLLQTPGRELLQGVPSIGDSTDEAIAAGPAERHGHFRKHLLP